MPKIEFRGQTYNDEFEMPYDIHEAYRREKEHRAFDPGEASAKSLSDIVDMYPQVKAMY